MFFPSYPLFSPHCSLRLILCCFPSLPHPSFLLPSLSPSSLLWLPCLIIVPTANGCVAIPDSLTREDNPLTVHFSSLGIVMVPWSPIRPCEAGHSEAPQLDLTCQTTLNIELVLACQTTLNIEIEFGSNIRFLSAFKKRYTLSLQ